MGIETQPLTTGKASGAQAELSSVELDDQQSRRAANFQTWGRSGPSIAFSGIPVHCSGVPTQHPPRKKLPILPHSSFRGKGNNSKQLQHIFCVSDQWSMHR